MKIARYIYEDLILNYPILEIIPDVFELTYDETNPEFIAKLCDLYEKHLPVSLNSWMKVNIPASNLKYLGEYNKQLTFVSYDIFGIFSENLKDINSSLIQVIGVHHSKSIKLPVYRILLKNYSLELIFRNNFYEWIVSVESKKTLNGGFSSLINNKEKVKPIDAGGFPDDKIFATYKENNSRFTVSFRDDYHFYTFIYMLCRAVFHYC